MSRWAALKKWWAELGLQKCHECGTVELAPVYRSSWGLTTYQCKNGHRFTVDTGAGYS